MIKPDLELERQLWSEGHSNIIGIDEVGRGPWAGPVIAGAVMLPKDHKIDLEIKDSKQMTEKRREEAFEVIKASDDIKWGIGVTSPEVIDREGISKAVRIAMEAAVLDLIDQDHHKVDILLIDGANVMDIPGFRQLKMNKGDSHHYSIAMASVIAKVIRDRIMIEYAKEYPEYGFEKHKGYGTKQHHEALLKQGICPIHRRSYAPIKKLLKLS